MVLDRRGGAGMWFLLGILVVLTIIVALQDTKHALIVKEKTGELWGTVVAAIGAVLFLRSGRARGADRRRAQLELGTLSNSFYEPRRRWLVDGGAVLGGVAGGLWWGASTWGVLWRGMLRGTANRGLLAFETGVVVGILAGGLVGASLGVYAGNVWERGHRRRRMQRAAGEIIRP